MIELLCGESWERRRLASVSHIHKPSRASRWSSRISRVVLPLLLVFLAVRMFAESPVSTFDAANKLYEQGKFIEAAAGYEKLVQTGQVSEAIYFNWGNAWFKAGRIGQAIAAYVQAERIAPRDPDVRANLQFARNQVQSPTLKPDKAWRWLGKLSLDEWTWLTSATAWAWLLLLTLIQWRRALSSALKTYALWLGVVTALVGICFGAAFYANRLTQRAIVVAPEAVARQAPLEESQNAFTLHDGAELQVVDQKDRWLQVRPDARRIGWIRKESVVLAPSS